MRPKPHKKEGQREKKSTVIVGRVSRIEMRRSGLGLTTDVRNKPRVIESCSVYKKLTSSSFVITRKYIKTANTSHTCSLLFGPSHLQVQGHLATA